MPWRDWRAEHPSRAKPVDVLALPLDRERFFVKALGPKDQVPEEVGVSIERRFLVILVPTVAGNAVSARSSLCHSRASLFFLVDSRWHSGAGRGPVLARPRADKRG